VSEPERGSGPDTGHGIGAPVRRREDRRFLTGSGCFGDDLARPGLLHGVAVRSPHPHARIRAVDTSAARALPGVALVLSGADLAATVRPVPSLTRTPPFAIPNRDGSPMAQPDQMPLATDKVRYLGEPVAFMNALRDALGEAGERIQMPATPLAVWRALRGGR